MRVTREIEGIIEALYRDFLALRLGPAWSELVMPALEAWTLGEEVDADAYGTRARRRSRRQGRGAQGIASHGWSSRRGDAHLPRTAACAPMPLEALSETYSFAFTVWPRARP